jgi:hypothetical protein
VVGLDRFYLKKWGLERLPDSEQLLMDNGCIPGKKKNRQQLKEKNVSEVYGHCFDMHYCILQVNKKLSSMNTDCILTMGLQIMHDG